jgi:hypothetical protein
MRKAKTPEFVAAPIKVVAPKKFNPRPSQAKAARHIVDNVAGALFADPASGKTATAAYGLRQLLRDHCLDFVVVIAPLQVCLNQWTDVHPETDFRKWADLAGLRLKLLHGDDKLARLAETADFYVLNPEGLEWLYDNWPAAWTGKRIGLVVDESTGFKSHTSLRFKIMAGRKYNKPSGETIVYEPLLNRFCRRLILTGTPTPEGLTDLWAQIYLLDQGRALGKYVTQYRRQYFYPSGYGGYDWQPKEGAYDAIMKRIAPYVMRLEPGELPPVVERELFVELPDKARAAYNQLDKEFMLQLKGGGITAANSGARSAKLRQMANGAVYLDGDDRRWKVFHDAKLDALERLRAELGPKKPLLIAYDFNHDLARLKELLGKDTPHLEPKHGAEHVAAWNRGELSNFLVHPKSGKHGLNLQFGGHGLFWFAQTFSFEEWYQLNRRLPRPGRTDPVFIYYALARGTVDEKARTIVPQLKGANQARFLQLLKQSYDASP